MPDFISFLMQPRLGLGRSSFVGLMLLALSQSGFAQTDKAVLSRLLTELEAMEVLISEAEQAPKASGTRLQFNYGYLRSDLDQVKAGIRQYISGPVVPRKQPLHPMNGHYGR